MISQISIPPTDISFHYSYKSDTKAMKEISIYRTIDEITTEIRDKEQICAPLHLFYHKRLLDGENTLLQSHIEEGCMIELIDLCK